MLKKTHPAFLFVLGTALGLCFCETARAYDAEPLVLMIVPSDQAEDFVPIVRAVQGQFADLDAGLRLVPMEGFPPEVTGRVQVAASLASEHGAIAVFWCDLGVKEQIYLFLAESNGNRMLVRRVLETADGSGSEALALIVRSSIREMMRGASIGMEVVEIPDLEPALQPDPEPPPSPVVPAEPTAPPVEQPHRLAAGVGYSLNVYSAEHPAKSGLALAFGVNLGRYITLTAGYDVVAPVREDHPAIKVRMLRHPVSIGGQLGWRPTRRLKLGGSVNAIVDFATIESYSPGEDIVAAGSTLDVLLSVAPGLWGQVDIVDRVAVFINVSGEIALKSVHYQAETEGGKETLLDSLPVQPWLRVGLLFELL